MGNVNSFGVKKINQNLYLTKISCRLIWLYDSLKWITIERCSSPKDRPWLYRFWKKLNFSAIRIWKFRHRYGPRTIRVLAFETKIRLFVKTEADLIVFLASIRTKYIFKRTWCPNIHIHAVLTSRARNMPHSRKVLTYINEEKTVYSVIN